jgi:hypothetical protein
MSDRVWRQLLTDAEQRPTRATDSVLRLALALWAADARAALTLGAREKIVQRLADPALLEQPFTAAEKAQLRLPLLTYIRRYRPVLLPTVEKQFDQEEA